MIIVLIVWIYDTDCMPYDMLQCCTVLEGGYKDGDT